jgi:dolichol-phosphate mannosyltransferase
MSFEKYNIAVVIPAYKVKDFIVNVVETVPEMVNHIIVIDDKCPQESGKIAELACVKTNQKLHVVYHEKNKGVGGAVITGYKKALELECVCAVKLDGDGQMDVKYLKEVVDPIIKGEADYVKGNRFVDFKALRSMPKIRLIGNSVLSFLLKLVSGYWDIMDPTNGYTAISSSTLQKINLDGLSKRYFFESDMLINLNIHKRVVKDVPMPAIYGNEDSSLNVKVIMVQFPPYLLRGLIKRISLKYFIYDFNMASVYLLCGLPMIFWGVGFGLYKWIDGIMTNTLTSTGTVMLSVLPLILGTQLLLQAINIDINSVPKK